MKLVGIADGSYEREGRKIEGFRFYFTDVREKVMGLATDHVWCNKTVGQNFLQCFDSPDQALGQEYQILYNRWGKAAGFQPIPSAAGRK